MACHNTFKNKFSCELYECRNTYNKLRVEGVAVDEGHCINLVKSVKDG